MEKLSSKSLGSFRTACYSKGDRDGVRTSLTNVGFRCLDLDAGECLDKDSLLRSLLLAFKAEFSPSDRLSWDAVADILWQQIVGGQEKRVALICHQVDVLVFQQLQLFVQLMEMLNSVGELVERQQPEKGLHPALMRIVLLGNGPSFVPWH